MFHMHTEYVVTLDSRGYESPIAKLCVQGQTILAEIDINKLDSDL